MPEDLVQLYNNTHADWPMIYFLMAFSVAVALFHTFIFTGLYQFKLKPKWLFFVLNPALVFFAGLIEKNMAPMVFIFLFISVFVFAILGMIYGGIRSGIDSAKERDRELKKSGKAGLPLWKKIAISLSGIIFIVLFFTVGPAYLILYFFIILPFLANLRGNNKKRFYTLQRTLPTSKIRSVAMGLAEISGKTEMIKSMDSHIKKKSCIGYYYTRENISRDKEGKNSYTLEYSETECNFFNIVDSTGKMLIAGNNIEFIDFDISERYESSGKRYTEYLLQQNMDVLLIGKAGITAENTPIIELEEIKNVFGIAPLTSVENYNNLRPILQSAAYFAYFWVILIALIMISDVNLRSTGLFIEHKKVLNFNGTSNYYQSEDASNTETVIYDNGQDIEPLAVPPEINPDTLK